MMVTSTSCVGVKQIHRPCPRTKIELNFETKGKSRWPFGWEILRELNRGGSDLAGEAV